MKRDSGLFRRSYTRMRENASDDGVASKEVKRRSKIQPKIVSDRRKVRNKKSLPLSIGFPYLTLCRTDSLQEHTKP